MLLGLDLWFLVVVFDVGGKFGVLLVFIVLVGVGVNLYVGVWYGVLMFLDCVVDFFVVDREGGGVNFEEVIIVLVMIIV